MATMTITNIYGEHAAALLEEVQAVILSEHWPLIGSLLRAVDCHGAERGMRGEMETCERFFRLWGDQEQRARHLWNEAEDAFMCPEGCPFCEGPSQAPAA